MYLSKNSLTSLDNIQQFRNVKVLSLADNLLLDLEKVSLNSVKFDLHDAYVLDRVNLSAYFLYSLRRHVLLAQLECMDIGIFLRVANTSDNPSNESLPQCRCLIVSPSYQGWRC